VGLGGQYGYFEQRKIACLGVHSSEVPGHPSNYILYGGSQYLWALSMEFASCHLSGAYNFEVAPTFW
jgi:hypothetical protein